VDDQSIPAEIEGKGSQMRFILLAALTLSSLANSPAWAAEPIARKIAGKIVVDGRLDEEDWQKAQPGSDFVWMVGAGSGPEHEGDQPAKTNVRVLFDDEAVYFGVRCQEPLMANLLDARVPRASMAIFGDDCIEVFLDPEGRGVNYYQFALSAGNDQFAAYYIESGPNGGGAYDGLWESAIHKGPDFWTAEIRIPLSALYYTAAGSFSNNWRINVTRERRPKEELTTWAPLKKSFLNPKGFLDISGMPKKSAAQDIRVARADVFLTGKSANGYAGEARIDILSNPAAFGDYSLSLTADGKPLASDDAVKLSTERQVVSFKGLSLAESAPTTLKATLVGRSRPFLGGAYFPVILRYEPIAITVDEPFYADCIFPDEEVSDIRGTVTLNFAPESLAKARLSVSLKGGDFEKMASVAKDEGLAAFILSVDDLQVGDYVLSAKLTSDGKVMASQEKRIRKLAPPAKGSCVRIDRNLNLVVTGRPIFARGWCGGGGDYLVSEPLMKKFPHGDSPYVNTWGDPPAAESQCDIEAERLVPAESAQAKLAVKPSQAMYDAMAKVIEQNRGDPELLWYYLCDEPECRGISPVYLKHQYDFIKERDPYHPVLIISREPKRFTECADILSPHPYVNPTVNASGVRKLETPMKSIRNMVREVYSSAGYRIPAWLTPQAFTYGFLDREADYPTFAEFNCMVYDAVANGAKGFTTFLYYDHFSSIDLRYGCPFLYESLAQLDEFLLEHPKSDPVKVAAPEDAVDACVKRHGDKFCLIAVNLLDKKIEASVESSSLRSVTELYGFREERTVPVKDGRLTLQFEPYQVYVLTNPAMGKTLKTIPAMLGEMEATRKALKKEGNILFGRGKEIEWSSSDTYITNLSLFTLTDGITDALGWRDVTGSGGQTPYVEAMFPTFTPKFQKAKVYTATVEDMDFLIWKAGEWKKVGEVRGNKNDVITFEFPKMLSTVKIHLTMPKSHPGTRAEIYEIELY
jgi:hypothetical protein